MYAFLSLTSFGKLTRDHVEHINTYCHERAVPPDDKTRISPSYQHARDSYAFGHLVEDVLTPEVLAGSYVCMCVCLCVCV